MNSKELASKIFSTSYLTGEFKLRSGKISNEYFDKYLFESDPYLLDQISNELIKILPKDTEIIAGLEMGGIPIATTLSLKTKIPLVFVRKKAKEYGTCKFAEGIDISDKKVCIIEDIITTGGQVILSANKLKELGAIVQDVVCVILRENSAKKLLHENNLNLKSLFKYTDFDKSE